MDSEYVFYFQYINNCNQTYFKIIIYFKVYRNKLLLKFDQKNFVTKLPPLNKLDQTNINFKISKFKK